MNLRYAINKLFNYHPEYFGLSSRRAIFPRLDEEIERYNRTKSPFCVAYVDIDRLKRVNDAFGHNVGYTVLKKVASIIKQSTGPNGFACRYGGDEFVLLFPGISLLEGIQIVENIRKKVEELKFPEGIHITVSIGIDEFQGGTADDILRNVNEYEFIAGKQGGNRVCHREI